MNNIPQEVQKASEKYGYVTAHYQGKAFGCKVYSLSYEQPGILIGTPSYLVEKFGIIHKASNILSDLIFDKLVTT